MRYAWNLKPPRSNWPTMVVFQIGISHLQCFSTSVEVASWKFSPFFGRPLHPPTFPGFRGRGSTVRTVNWASPKGLWHSIKYWLVHRDPYNALLSSNIIPILLDSILSPTARKANILRHCSTDVGHPSTLVIADPERQNWTSFRQNFPDNLGWSQPKQIAKIATMHWKMVKFLHFGFSPILFAISNLIHRISNTL